jgi:hypothetical protein
MPEKIYVGPSLVADGDESTDASGQMDQLRISYSHHPFYFRLPEYQFRVGIGPGTKAVVVPGAILRHETALEIRADAV